MFEFLGWKDNHKKECKDKCKKQCVCDVCPPPTLPNEPPGCEQARQQVHGDIFNAFNGWQFGFINAQQDLPAILNPTNPNSCEGVFGGGFRLASVEELQLIVNDVRRAYGNLCPMLIWSTFGGVATLVYFVPQSLNPFIVVPTTSTFCPAYSICINTGG